MLHIRAKLNGWLARRFLAGMVQESGNPVGFDAEAWITNWIEQPVPALGARPVDLLSSEEGLAKVSAILAQAQAGAFA